MTEGIPRKDTWFALWAFGFTKPFVLNHFQPNLVCGLGNSPFVRSALAGSLTMVIQWN